MWTLGICNAFPWENLWCVHRVLNYITTQRKSVLLIFPTECMYVCTCMVTISCPSINNDISMYFFSFDARRTYSIACSVPQLLLWLTLLLDTYISFKLLEIYKKFDVVLFESACLGNRPIYGLVIIAFGRFPRDAGSNLPTLKFLKFKKVFFIL